MEKTKEQKYGVQDGLLGLSTVSLEPCFKVPPKELGEKAKATIEFRYHIQLQGRGAVRKEELQFPLPYRVIPSIPATFEYEVTGEVTIDPRATGCAQQTIIDVSYRVGTIAGMERMHGIRLTEAKFLARYFTGTAFAGTIEVRTTPDLPEGSPLEVILRPIEEVLEQSHEVQKLSKIHTNMLIELGRG